MAATPLTHAERAFVETFAEKSIFSTDQAAGFLDIIGFREALAAAVIAGAVAAVSEEDHGGDLTIGGGDYCPRCRIADALDCMSTKACPLRALARHKSGLPAVLADAHYFFMPNRKPRETGNRA